MVGLFGVLHWSGLANLIECIENGQKLTLDTCPSLIDMTLVLFFPEMLICAEIWN